MNSLPKTVTRQRRGCDFNPGPNRRGGKDGTGKHGTKGHGWNSRHWKTQDQISRVENARPPSIGREMDKYKDANGPIHSRPLIALRLPIRYDMLF